MLLNIRYHTSQFLDYMIQSQSVIFNTFHLSFFISDIQIWIEIFNDNACKVSIFHTHCEAELRNTLNFE